MQGQGHRPQAKAENAKVNFPVYMPKLIQSFNFESFSLFYSKLNWFQATAAIKTAVK